MEQNAFNQFLSISSELSILLGALRGRYMYAACKTRVGTVNFLKFLPIRKLPKSVSTYKEI